MSSLNYSLGMHPDRIFDAFPAWAERDEAPNEETFEWLALIQSVNAADTRPPFTVIEAGAGFGRWTERAWRACSAKSLLADLFAIEAESTHFADMVRFFEKRGVDTSHVTMINAALVTEGQSAHFSVGHADEWYGQAVVKPDTVLGDWPNAQVEALPAITLDDILSRRDRFDLLDMDIQGMEGEIIPHAIDAITKKVKMAFVATHSNTVHADVFRAFMFAGWKTLASYVPNAVQSTPLGRISFQDGIQWWMNWKLS